LSSENPGEDRFAVLRVVREFLPVALVLFESPYGHLNNADNQEDVPTDQLCLYTENGPGARLPKVIRAADEAEAPAVWDVALNGAWAPQVLKDYVRHEVKELKDDEEACSDVVKDIRAPGRRRVSRPQVPVHGSKAKDQVVVDTIFEHVREWHGLTREAMDEGGLKLALQVMKQYHEYTKLLVERQFGILSVDAFAED